MNEEPTNFFPGGRTRGERFANPFLGIPFQYLPYQNLDQMLWWANHFLYRFDFYKAALEKIANYFVTSIVIECDDSESKKKYEEIFTEIEWKQILRRGGLDLLAYANMFCSVSPGFHRFLKCPRCERTSSIDKLFDYKFKKDGSFEYHCPGCNVKGRHEIIDRISKEIEDITVTFWNPSEVICRHDRSNNKAEYYWNIPQAYITAVLKEDNKFYSKVTPKVIYDSILKKKMLEFVPSNFIHLQESTPSGLYTGGKSIPRCIYMFDKFFMLKVLERYNEVICYEDIVPFRVFAMAGQSNSQNNPILNMNSGVWKDSINMMVEEHRLDPGAYHTFPMTFEYQQLGGEGKTLAPTEMMVQMKTDILSGFSLPQELYNMTMKMDALGPSLRLFENTWSHLISIYNKLLMHIGDVAGKLKGLPKAKIKLRAVTMADDIEQKGVIAQLVSANAIARSELLGLYNFDYRDQLRKKLDEEQAAKELEAEQQAKNELAELADKGDGQGGGSSPGDVLDKAQDIAEQLYPLDGAQRREKLQEIKGQDQTLYSAVKAKLEEMTNQDKSNGVKDGKKQQQQGQGGQQ